jgi:hypothetical protein
MKKLIACILIVALLGASVNTYAGTKGSGRGGVMGFIAGCCFGIRAGTAYNDGKEIHPTREWLMLIPIVGLVIAVWNGIDCYQGLTTKQLVAQYGAMYY